MEAVIKNKKNSTFGEINIKKKKFSKEYLEYRRKWNENPIKNIVERFPIHLDIEVTSHCNLKCVMCFQSFNPPKPGFINFDLFKRLIDEGAKKGLCSIKLQYRGEPLLHPKIVEMVKYAKQKGIIEVMFNTNGNLLDEKKARWLIEAGMDKIIFSVDGYTKEFYEKIRRGGNFNVVLKNIKRLQELKKELGKDKPIVRVQMVKLKSLKNPEEHVKKYIEFWSKIAEDVAVEDENEWNYNKNKDTVICKDFKCTQPWQRLFVMWNGEIRLCCGDLYGELKLDNAKDISIEEVWHSQIVEAIRKQHIAGNSHKINICNKCGGRRSIIFNNNLPHEAIDDEKKE